MQLINIHNSRRQIYLFCRDDKGNLIIDEKDDFFPYFYEKDSEGTFKTIDGQLAKKIFVSEPSDVPKTRSMDSYEADILFTKRYMIDKIKQLDKCPIKYAFIDIEVLADELPNVQQALYPISCISVYNSFTKEIKTWYLEDYSYLKNLELQEKKMLDEFILYMHKEKFDLWLSWYVGFDYNYLYNRIESIKNYGKKNFGELISPINKSRYGDGEVYYPAGISIVDYLQWDKKVTLNRRKSYELDNVAQEELKDEPNEKIEFGKLNSKIKEKNIRDIERMVKLEEKLKYIDYFDEIRRLTKVEWEDMIWNSRILDMLLLEEAKNKKIVLPMKPAEERGTLTEKEEYQGAYRDVFKTGRISPVGVYDIGCYSEDTEILTENGWMTYDKLYVNNKLATFNINTNKIEFQSMLHLNIQKVKNVEMYNFKNKHTDQLLTWNHKVLYKQTTKKYRTRENNINSWHIRFAKDVPIYHSIFPLGAEIKDRKNYNISDELLKLHAWIITEGSNSKRKINWNNNYTITQSEKANLKYCKEIDELFEKLKWKVYKSRRKGIRKHERNWHINVSYSKNIHLEDNYKIIPLWMLQKLSLRQLKILYIELMKGDGSKRDEHYYASGNLARNRFQYLCILLGKATLKGKKYVTSRIGKYTSIATSRFPKRKMKYSGIIWCPTVANGFVVVRRKGKAFISGNSAYPSMITNFCLDPANIDTPKLQGVVSNSLEIRNTWFKQNPDTILPTVVKKIMTIKNNIKDELSKCPLNSEQHKRIKIKYDAIKSVVNSAYGVFGLRFFRLFKKEVASATTFLVRDLLHYVQDKLEKQGYEIIYIDTDSIMINNNSDDISSTLNEYVRQWAKEKYEKTVDVEFEYKGYFDPIILLTKCRYKGWLKTDKGIEEKTKGIEAKRKDSTTYMKKFQTELLDKIKNKEIKENIFKWIKEEIKLLPNQQLKDVAFPCKLGRPIEKYKNIPIFVRALNNTPNFKKKVGNNFYYIFVKPEDNLEITTNIYYDNELIRTLNENISRKEGIEYIRNKLQKPELDSSKISVLHQKEKPKNVMAFDEEINKHITKDMVNWDMIIRRNIMMKLDTIFEAMGWDVKEIGYQPILKTPKIKAETPQIKVKRVKPIERPQEVEKVLENGKIGINVLSLFDGISCGQVALERAGIKVNKYLASEIDKYAIKIAMKNYPNTIQLGDIIKIKGNDLPKIDLLMGGSPCQGFSFAGKQLNFDDPRSKLFFEFVRLLKECKPRYFLLENVKMKKEYQDIISKCLGVEPIEINSALVSAQNRKRLYWTNIPNIIQPKDKNIYLKDILEKDIDVLKKYKVNKTPSRIKMWEGKCKNITNEKKSSCLVTKQDRWNSQGLVAFENFCRFLTPIENERLQTLPDNYTQGIIDVQRDKCLGNAWTVNVISHILLKMEEK